MRQNEWNACVAMLGDLAGGPIEIARVEAAGGDWAPVRRLRLTGPAAMAIGPSVIVKTRRHEEDGWGYDPSFLAADHAALATIHHSGLSIAPEPLAWDEVNGVLIMRDLTPARTIEDVLNGSDPDTAGIALAAMASAVGTMQATTRLTGYERWNLSTAMRQFPQRWKAIVESAGRLGFPNPEPASNDAATVAMELDSPRWQTLCHTDLTPNNGMVVGANVSLIDFEYAGMRHCMVDGAMFSLSFPQYGSWAALPETLVEQMEIAYRSALAVGLPQARDDAAYDLALATGCLAWTLIRLARMEKIADPGQDPDLALRRRSQIVHTVDSCLRVLANTGAYPALHAWLAAVVGEMRCRWSEARVKPGSFPAFAGLDHSLT